MNKNSNSFEIIFDSKSENESFARVVVAAFCTRLDPTLEEISDFKTDLYYQNPDYLKCACQEGKLLD